MNALACNGQVGRCCNTNITSTIHQCKRSPLPSFFPSSLPSPPVAIGTKENKEKKHHPHHRHPSQHQHTSAPQPSKMRYTHCPANIPRERRRGEKREERREEKGWS